MNAIADYKLFTPLTIGKDLVLKNRIVMAPMGRARVDPVSYAPLEITQLYYEQRASAGLIITEATAISEQGYGWYSAPALYNDAHAEAWKKVVDRVHARGGKIFFQLWHMGRQAHSSFNSNHEVVAPSAIGLQGGHIRDSNGDHASYELPRALEPEEIATIVDDYRRSAALAKKAGFDGVEIHAGNGYLIDQFLQSVSNHRTDKYGGSFENRTRFLLEVIEAIKKEWPSDRISVRISPNGAFGEMGSEDNAELFTYAARQLRPLGLAYVAVLDGAGFGTHDSGRLLTALDIKKAFQGLVFGANSYTRDIAEGALRSGAADAVCFGRLYISNPDLVERFQNDWPLAPQASYEYFWDASMGAEGYTTFPAYTPSK